MSRKVQLIITLVLFGLLALFIGIFKPVLVSGAAMEPNYRREETFLTNKLGYLISKPRRGDVVVFRYSQQPKFKGMSRIIGLPSDRLMIKEGKVYINGRILNESYIKSGVLTLITDQREFRQVSETEALLEETRSQKTIDEGQEIIIPENNYFMMGDNRENSIDSRSLGFVEQKDIIGKIFIKYKL